ncbi:MAG: cation:dicarboxylate symporter family transporter [Desulfobaccales bacterium]
MGKKNLSFLFHLPLPIRVVSLLIVGFTLGLAFPKNTLVHYLFISGTFFPKTIVTLCAFLIFNLLAAAMAKLSLFHKERASRLFGIILGMYVFLGGISLIYATVWLHILAHLRTSLPGAVVPGALTWILEIGHTFTHVMSQQPLLQALAGGLFVGWLCAKVPALHRIAHGFIAIGDLILWAFKKILWYYPIMIGCLAIGIPMKFGTKGMVLYADAVLWIAIITITWSLMMIIITLLFTKRTFKQVISYYGTVWPTGFGTGGSYDTLAVNIISAEEDLGLHEEVAEISIVFGTVLNKNNSTIAVFAVTIAVCRMLNIPISLSEIVMMIAPVMILGLESPGIPGGAGYFMSPIVGVLLGAPNMGVFVTTFIAVYSGLVPMLATAGNTTDDGMVGAFLQDVFGRFIWGAGHIAHPQVEEVL